MKRGKRRVAPQSYRHRSYRTMVGDDGLVSCRIQVRDTDLLILADRDVNILARELTLQYRLQVEAYIQRYPHFLTSLRPLPEDFLAPAVVRAMLAAGAAAGVGPMAAVAGAIAEYVGAGLRVAGCDEVVVENGGDIFLHRYCDCTVAIFAGESPLSLRLGLHLPAGTMPLAVCTSSGTVGHSLSFGRADSVTVVAGSAALADAVATRLGNEIGRGKEGDGGIAHALEIGRRISGVRGVVVICGEQMGAVGEVELIGIS